MVSPLESLITLAIDQDPGGSILLERLRDLVTSDKLDQTSVDDLMGPPGSATRQRTYRRCVQTALSDHALTERELLALRQLRRALSIEDDGLP